MTDEDNGDVPAVVAPTFPPRVSAVDWALVVLAAGALLYAVGR